MINIGIIGCGRIAQVRHIPEYDKNQDARIYGVYDINEKRAKEVAEKYHAIPYKSYEEMLADSAIDAVSICTANYSHCEISVKALTAGKHVLCEKPMAVTYEECRAMVEAAKKSGKYLMICQQERLLPAHIKAKELLQQGSIGEILSFRTNFRHSGPETWTIDQDKVWFFDKKSAAFGAMADLGIHKADLIHYLLDDTIKSAMAVTGALDKKNPDGTPISVDDNAICIYRTEKGILGTMEVSWTCYGREDKSTVIYGTQGCLKINSDTKYPLILEKRNGERIYYNMDDYKGHSNGTGMVDTWIQCLKTKTPPEISGESSFESMKAVFAALESAQKGCMISVDNLEEKLGQ